MRRGEAGISAGNKALIVHLVDGTYELFRHFYGLRQFRVKSFASRGSLGGRFLCVTRFLKNPTEPLGPKNLHRSFPAL